MVIMIIKASDSKRSRESIFRMHLIFRHPRARHGRRCAPGRMWGEVERGGGARMGGPVPTVFVPNGHGCSYWQLRTACARRRAAQGTFRRGAFKESAPARRTTSSAVRCVYNCVRLIRYSIYEKQDHGTLKSTS